MIRACDSNSLMTKEKQMFTADFLIDTVQNGKKTFVNTFITHEETKTVLNEYIDNQTAYTKAVTKAATDFGTKLVSDGLKTMEEITKFDIAKFDIAKMFKTAK